ncbi:hypothetical protein BC937DRAFT_89198 [Endogone sp. FLAS-F59071]|nr:hypothetical protein BC937DRAFT_89198 [Endogone sp. FLAS-F59071]|eukprot:RUS18049.1 hypothetical protein BC937DRAFT_89198 [Endogone sp. FLAS-F59071]
MPSCYFARTLAVRPPQRLSLALCGWLALFVLVATPQGVSADCCPFGGASFYQDSVVIYKSDAQPPGELPIIDQSNSMGVDYSDDRVISVVANQQSNGLKVGHRCNYCERGSVTLSAMGVKGILLNFNTSCDSISAAAFYVANNLDSFTLPYIQASPIVALIQRGNCSFTDKLNIASTTAVTANLALVGVILYDNVPDSLLGASPNISWNISTYPDNDVDEIIAMVGNPSNNNFVPTIFVRNGLGLVMLQQIDNFAFNASIPMNTTDGNSVQLRKHYRVLDVLPQELGPGALDATIIFRLHRRHTLRMLTVRVRTMREITKLPRSILETFPIRLYNAEEVKNQSCAICLDDFVEDESNLRLLPCSHGFCVECIDPWLSTKSAQCPICKFNFLPSKSSTDLSEGDPTETVTIEMTTFPAVSEAENMPQIREIWEQVEMLDPEVSKQERQTKMEMEKRMDEEKDEEVQGVELETVVIDREAMEEEKIKAVEEEKTEGGKAADPVEEERLEAAEVEKADAVQGKRRTADAVKEEKVDVAEEKAGMAQENRSDIA